MITFAAENEDFRKRKRVHRACELCKKRRRRCEHAFDQEEEDSTERKSTTGTNQSGPLPPSARYNDARSLVGKGLIERDPTTPASVLSNEDEATVHAKVHSAGPSHMKARRRSDIPRFVGDLNPEATLLGRATVPAGGRCSDQDEVGVWIESENETQDTAWSGDPKATITDSRPTILTGPFKKDHENALWDYLNALGAFDGPPPSDQDALVETYFSEVHPILPMLDETAFRQAYMDGSESKSLVQALCLVASKHHSAATHLRFSDGSPALSPRDFAKSLYTGLNAAVSLKTEPDKLVLIRVLALLSLHSEGPDGAEMASLHLAQAIHHAQTLGLHLRRSQMTSENKKFQDLFWCLWSLDKLQAGINGRPVIIADRDVGVKSLSSPDQRQNAFQVWVRIAVLMNKVINLYRPNADSNTPGWDDVFPTFEDVVGTHDGTDLKASHLALLELFYHAVAILACRSKSSRTPTSSTPSHIRQSLSAVSIMSIMTCEFSRNLPPLPVVPYALSLSMGVAYRHFRQSTLLTLQLRAKADLENCCMLLRNFSNKWRSAESMARLGEKVLDKVNGVQDKIRTLQTSNTPHMPRLSIRQQWEAQRNNRTDVNQPPDQWLPTAVTGQHSAQDPTQPALDESSNHEASHHPVIAQPSSTNYPTQETLSDDILTQESPDWIDFDSAFNNIDAFFDAFPDLSFPTNLPEMAPLDGPAA